MQTGTSIPPARSRRTTVTPSRSGIVTSRTMTAGGRRATASSASLPPAAVDTAKPSRRSARSRACRTDASSSTTRTRGSGVAMRSELLERGLDLRHVEIELGGQLRRELVAQLRELVLMLVLELVKGGLHLGGAQAERLGERGGAGAFPLGMVLLEVLLEGVERLLELGLRDAERVLEIGLAIRSGAALRAQLVERRADLGRVDAELGRERGRDVLAAVPLAPLRAHRVERGLQLRLGHAERGREIAEHLAAVERRPRHLALDLPE